MPPKEANFHNRQESYDILETVQNVQQNRGLYKLDEMKQMHPDFAKDNPELFKKCYDQSMTPREIDQLVYMLQTRNRVKSGEITFKKANELISVYFAQQYQPELLSKNGFKK